MYNIRVADGEVILTHEHVKNAYEMILSWSTSVTEVCALQYHNLYFLVPFQCLEATPNIPMSMESIN